MKFGRTQFGVVAATMLAVGAAQAQDAPRLKEFAPPTRTPDGNCVFNYTKGDALKGSQATYHMAATTVTNNVSIARSFDVPVNTGDITIQLPNGNRWLIPLDPDPSHQDKKNPDRPIYGKEQFLGARNGGAGDKLDRGSEALSISISKGGNGDVQYFLFNCITALAGTPAPR